MALIVAEEKDPRTDITSSMLKEMKESLKMCKYDGGRGSSGGKKKRKLSDYQKHMSVCLKDEGNFQSCVIDWREGNKQHDRYVEKD